MVAVARMLITERHGSSSAANGADRGGAMTQRTQHHITNPQLITTLRQARGMTISRLAAEVRVSRVTIGNWESGRVRSTSPLYAQRLSSALAVAPVLLFGPDEQ